MTIIFETTDGRLWSTQKQAVENQKKLMYPLALMDAGHIEIQSLMDTNAACAIRERILDVEKILANVAKHAT